MADQQIWNPAVADAQSVYQVSGDVRFILKAVNADFMDNGAASGWLPAVIIASDAGHVIARAVDQAVAVAGGDAAAVSWFPGVKHVPAAAAATDTPWAMLDSTGGEALLHSGTMTFTFATGNFNTDDATVFTLRSGSPPFQGISIHEVGIYYVSWWIRALVNGNLATAPSATMIQITPGISFAGTDSIELDLARAEDYGRIVQGTAPNRNLWDIRYVALVAVETVTGERALTLGASNRSTTFDFPASGGQGLFGHIFAARLSGGLSDYSHFF